MADHFRQAQVELERLGYEYQSRNTKGGETWEHGSGHSVVIYPGMKEHTHRVMLRDCRKVAGVKAEHNKRKVAQIKERDTKRREIDRREAEARKAWLEARIRELDMASRVGQLTPKQRQLLNDRLRELRELDQLMRSIPSHQ